MTKKRLRDAGFKLAGVTGENNAITDVAGVEVGYSTIVYGEQEDYKGNFSEFARTGVTMIFPRGKQRSVVQAGRFNLNGNGEMTGSHWLDDSGFLHGPIGLTNTHSVGVVRDSIAKWMVKNNFYYPLVENGQEIPNCSFFYPVVGETWDGLLNDTNGFHVEEKHVQEAIEDARSGEIKEGNVGGGTGMICHGFKGGTGTSSRQVETDGGTYTLGALVQANQGSREYFKLYGVPVGQLIDGHESTYNTLTPKPGTGSIVVVLATDAPLSQVQLHKLCKRIPMGLSQLGAGNENGSGDIFLGFTTANEEAYTTTLGSATTFGDDSIDPLYTAVVEVVEESILNALFQAEDMIGMAGNDIKALPQDKLREVIQKYRPDCLESD